MMMAATRRSASSLSRRGKSPKPKKRSRRASNEEQTDRDRAASRMDFGDSGRTTRLEQRPYSPASRDENERGRAESRLDFGEGGERVSRSGQTDRDRAASRMDFGDSGRTTRLEQRPYSPASRDENERGRAESRLGDFGEGGERDSRSGARTSQGSEARDSYGTSKHGDVADSGIDSGNGVAEPESLVGIHRRSSSSDHVDDGHVSSSPDKPHHTVPSDRSAVQKPTSDEKKDQPAVTVTVTDHSKPESPRASRKRRKSKPKRDRHSASADQSPAAAKPPLATSSDKSAMSDSSTDTEDKESSDGSTLAGSPARSKPQPGEGKASVTEKNGDSEHVDSDQAVEKRKKLEARLEQAKTSLQSPHVNAAVDAFEMAEGPLVSPPNTGLMQEFRRLFQQELTRLRMELDTFRRFCSKQMEQEATRLDPERSQDDASSDRSEYARQEKEAAEHHRAAIKDEEIKKREDRLAERVEDLQEYEKEILEVESMLNQRQAICERRQSALLTLDEELQGLREDIFNKKENLRDEGDTSAERARKHWDFVRRNLTDKQAMLEATIQRYRTQIAAANASLAAKDSLIAHLQKHVKEGQESLKSKDKKMHQLEEKLVLVMEQTHKQSIAPTTTTATTTSLSSAVEPRRPLSRSSSARPPSSMQRQTSESPERNAVSRAGGRRMSVSDGSLVLTAPTGGRRMSTHHPDTPVFVKNAESGNARRESTKSRGGNDTAANGVHVPRDPGVSGGPNSGNGISRDLAAKRNNYQRTRSTPHSMINSATNASAACNIL